MGQIQVEHLPTGELNPDPANPRRISDKELEPLTRSIRESGLVIPIIARREDVTSWREMSGDVQQWEAR